MTENPFDRGALHVSPTSPQNQGKGQKYTFYIIIITLIFVFYLFVFIFSPEKVDISFYFLFHCEIDITVTIYFVILSYFADKEGRCGIISSSLSSINFFFFEVAVK